MAVPATGEAPFSHANTMLASNVMEFASLSDKGDMKQLAITSFHG